MATGNPGNLSDGTGPYFSCKVLSLAVRPAKYIQSDIYLAEKRERCCRCRTLAWVPGGWQSKGSGTRKSRHPREALGDGTGAAGAAEASRRPMMEPPEITPRIAALRPQRLLLGLQVPGHFFVAGEG